MEHLFARVRNYLDLKFKYYKLLAVEKLAESTSKILAIIVFMLLAGLAVLLFAGALVVLVAQWMDSYLWAFLIVGGFFLAIACLFLGLRKSIFTNRMVKTFSKVFFSGDKEEEDYEW